MSLRFARIAFFVLSMASLDLVHTNELKYTKECHRILDKRLSRTNMRYGSYMQAFRLMGESEAKVIVETGTARCGDKNCAGDGCSTIIFGHWAKKNGARLYSIDNCANHIASAKKGARHFADYIEFVTEDSLTALANFRETIDFLYLDSFDYDASNPLPSQEHHLKEVIAAYPHLSPTCPIMIDDCSLPHGGKGVLAIKYLLEHGWSIVYEGYQVILVRN